MSRIYWDTMLFVYWLEDREPYSGTVGAIYRGMSERGDSLFTSTFTLAELLVGPRKQNDLEMERKILGFFEGGALTLLPFETEAAKRYGSVRSSGTVSPADAIHLACAAAAGVDLFLSNDRSLRRLVVPGIQFIDGIDTTLFDAGP